MPEKPFWKIHSRQNAMVKKLIFVKLNELGSPQTIKQNISTDVPMAP